MALSYSFSTSPYLPQLFPPFFNSLHLNKTQLKPNLNSPFFTLSCSFSQTPTPITQPTNPYPSEPEYGKPLLKKRKRYRKELPGESVGITEEMRFVAMKLKNDRAGSTKLGSDCGPSDEGMVDGGDEEWEPTIEGFLKYLVDSKVVFDTIERVVEDSHDVSYAYFRRTRLERSGSLDRDLDWFGQQDLAIPELGNPGVSYAAYLKELAEKSAPLFLSHFYNIYFSHIAGGQVIAKQVSEQLLDGRELEFFRWEGDAEEFLKDVREKLNRLSEHWSRDDKNKCLKEATKSFRYMGQIVRLIIL